MKKLNNKGLTLVELIIAISMATMVIAATTVFLYNAEKSYRISQYSVDLQMEAQILMEQMSNWVLESNHIEVKNISGESDALILYQMPVNKKTYSETSNVPISGAVTCSRMIIYSKNGKLYIDVDDTSGRDAFNEEIKTTPASFACLEDASSPDPKNCIGEHVEYFTVTFPAGVDPANANSVEVKLSMKEGGNTSQGQSYIVNNVFSLRNSVFVPTPEPSSTPVTPP